MKATSIVFSGLAILLATSPFAHSASAATLTVCPSGCEYSTIQTAIASAHNGDVISILKGHYFETLNTLGKKLTLNGINNRQAIIDGNGTGTVITIPGNLVLITNLTITRGFGVGGGISVTDNASLNLRHSILVNNYSTSSGGGIFVNNVKNGEFSNLTIFDCTITDNTGDGGGGGVEIDMATGTADIESSTIARNTTGYGGGGVEIFSQNITATVNDSSIVDNRAGAGGGISAGTLDLEFPLYITNSTIAGNSSMAEGGGVVYGSVRVFFNNDVLTRNVAGTDGGGIYAFTAPTSFTGTPTYVVGNSASGDGGGAFLFASVTTGSAVVIKDNKPNNCRTGTVCP